MTESRVLILIFHTHTDSKLKVKLSPQKYVIAIVFWQKCCNFWSALVLIIESKNVFEFLHPTFFIFHQLSKIVSKHILRIQYCSPWTLILKTIGNFFLTVSFKKKNFPHRRCFRFFSGHFLLFMKEGMWPKMMKNVNQEGSLCLEQKSGENQAKKVKGWILIFFDFFQSLSVVYERRDVTKNDEKR